MILFLVGLILGAIGVIAAEAAAVLYFVKRLNQKAKKAATFSSTSLDSTEVVDHQQSLDFAYNKKGFVWVLESERIPKEKVPKEQKKKKELLEVSPARKHAKIKDRDLILTAPDGLQTGFPLKGCLIEAVSATSLSSRKWAKRFPIKVENKTSVIYNGSKIIYIFLETSWEKESWCNALRLASCKDKKRLDWFTKLNEEFHTYLASLNAGYPSFMKPAMGMIGESPSMGLISDPIERASTYDGSSSKVRLLLKKLARKASKHCIESKAFSSYSGREERKIYEKFRPSQDSVLGASSVKSGTSKLPNISREENADPLSSMFPQSKSQSISDADSDDKFIFDEGTLCWNMLVFRLFFDAKNNVGLTSSIQARIQRTLSNMRTPSYVGEIICTKIDTGNLPPYVHGMRVLPTDMNEVWAFEVDIEYAGGVVLDVETRLEVREPDVQKGIVDASSVEASSVGDVSSDLLEGFEYFGKQLNVPDEPINGQAQKDEVDPKLDGLKNQKSAVSATTSGSRWKSILNSIAKQVSQVPIALSIRVAALRGTLRIHIKPPPSDQLWLGFTSMPDIEFDLESSVGDHKITSGQVALFLINRFKASIRETMVLPNCENISIPWMLAEKDDWVPRNVAPFIWLNHEGDGDHATACETFSSQTADAKTTMEATGLTSSDELEDKIQNSKNLDCSERPKTVSKVASMPTTTSSSSSIQKSKSLEELRTPLLATDKPHEACQRKIEEISECLSSSTSPTQSEKQIIVLEEDDSRSKKSGRKARMLDLGKNMKGKFEEKRRHIEEKGRHIVEKMRGP